jgi:hypothetical protein
MNKGGFRMAILSGVKKFILKKLKRFFVRRWWMNNFVDRLGSRILFTTNTFHLAIFLLHIIK